MILKDGWLSQPEALRPVEGEIHAWLVSLEWSPAGIEWLQQVLSAEEIARSKSYYFLKDRRHFTAARGMLRIILGRCLGVEPQRLEFSYGPNGKPAIESPWEGRNLSFNLSHSNGLGLFAAALNRSVGVDIEWMRPDPERIQIADSYFSPGEAAALRSLNAEKQQEAFYNCWTRKEAYMKATGKGLALPLDKFEVSLKPGEKAALLRNELDSSEVGRWKYYSLPPTPGFAASLVSEGKQAVLRCWSLGEDMVGFGQTLPG